MYGGIVELRSPFMNREVVDFGLRIPTRHRDDKDGGGGGTAFDVRVTMRITAINGTDTTGAEIEADIL